MALLSDEWLPDLLVLTVVCNVNMAPNSLTYAAAQRAVEALMCN